MVHTYNPRRMKQGGLEFKVILSYIVKLHLAGRRGDSRTWSGEVKHESVT
jgi:hypothetical protein